MPAMMTTKDVEVTAIFSTAPFGIVTAGGIFSTLWTFCC
jgi:hypothetical protein